MKFHLYIIETLKKIWIKLQKTSTNYIIIKNNVTISL